MEQHALKDWGENEKGVNKQQMFSEDFCGEAQKSGKGAIAAKIVQVRSLLISFFENSMDTYVISDHIHA